MGIAKKTFLNLFPRGKAHDLQGNGRAFQLAVGDSFDDLFEKIKSAVENAQPGKATFLLREWCETLGIEYNTSDIDALQKQLETIYSSTGGQTSDYLNSVVQREFPAVSVESIDIKNEAGAAYCGLSTCGEDDGFTSLYSYRVSGTVNTDDEAQRVADILQHYAPLHLSPETSLVVLGATGKAFCKVGITGLANCGED